MKLIRNILLEVEKYPAGKPVTEISFAGVDDATIVKHVEMLIKAGLLDGQTLKLAGVPAAYHIDGLTWEGHDFADAVRDQSIWQKTKDNVLKPTASFTFSMIVEHAKAEIKSI